MSEVKFCKDCVWSFPDKNAWNLRCKNPKVNAKDNWALGNTDFCGSACHVEREVKWFAACGQSGKQWKAKDENNQTEL